MKLEAKARLVAGEVDDSNVGNQLLRALKTLDTKPTLKSRSSVREGVSYTFYCEEGHSRSDYIQAVASLDSSSNADSSSVTFTSNTKIGVVYEETFLVLSTDGADGGGRVVTIVHKK